MYITKVSGHRQATMAIKRAIRLSDPSVEVPSINGFGYTYPRLEKIVNKTYMSIIRRTPRVWDFLYDNPKVFKQSSSLKNFLNRTSHKKLKILFDKYQPGTVVCTQAFPCGMVADYKRTFNLPFTLIGVLTDFAPHLYWLNKGVDYYIVPSQEAKTRFMQEGIPEEAIKVYGIPIQNKFSHHPDKGSIAQKLGLDLRDPVVLIMGGGQGLGPIEETVKALANLKRKIQIIVTTGTNKKLREWLAEFSKTTHQKIVVYEFTRTIDELMEVATLIVTKPGGMTTAECLAKGLPMVIVNPIPGQEMRNTEFLTQNGIAIHIKDVNSIATDIISLLNDPQHLKAMREAALKNGHPNAAFDIAKLILDQPQLAALEL